jgi:uncharacterized protein
MTQHAELSPIHIIPTSPKRSAWIDNTRIKKLQVIVKTVERCNINCSYCYYFNGGDNSFETRPPTIQLDAIDSTIAFLLQGVSDFNIANVEVVFHGGEPMMQSKRSFDSMCKKLREAFKDNGVLLNLAIQTNGTLVDEEWCDLLSRNGVAVGISIDGPKHVNDKYRLDHKGRSTYEATVAGIECLRAYEKKEGISFGLGSLTVINSEYDYKEIYRHLTETLGFKRVGFLLPNCSHDSFFELNATPERFGVILNDIFDAWSENPVAEVIHIERNLKFFNIGCGASAVVTNPELRESVSDAQVKTIDNQIIIVHSDGSISVDDSLIPASTWRNGLTKGHTKTTTLRQWLSSSFFFDLFSAINTLPSQCTGCSWKNLCRGGDMENRFSAADSFDRNSVFCRALDQSFSHMVDYLLAHGYPPDRLLQKLV